MSFKILCVDDDVNILQGFKRGLRREFDIYIAESGQEALTMIASEGPFAVIVSDMRMPGMDGVQLLSRVREVAPQTVRVMLTGNADQQTAMDAVNEGHIFRFLTKPCPPEMLAKTIHAGIEQYRLVTAERQLLEQTLNKSIQVLVDILGLVNPTAFNRSTRVRKMTREIAEKMRLKNPWQVEFAAMLSQIGCVTVPEEILQKIANGSALSEKEAVLYHQHPQVGHDLIARIPRLEAVAEIIANQNKRVNDEVVSSLPSSNFDTVSNGARILKVVFDFDKLLQTGHLPRSAYHELADRIGWYDPTVLSVLKEIIELDIDEFVTLDVFVVDLKPGMILDQPLYSTRDSLLLSAGQEITLSLILRLINFAEAGFISKKIRVNVPVASLDKVMA
ncbi:MAG: response regulator [Acidobacteria bacterium]|nr:response regulator [Acidobacteriota bacterium]